MLILHLERLPASTLGSYDGRMPARSLFLHPLAAPSFLKNIDRWVCSDIYRSPEASLVAMKTRKGAQPPGYSAHNFGLAIDLDIKATMKNLEFKTKTELDVFMEKVGWFCHRRDHKLDHEAWHYTFLGTGAFIAPQYKTIVWHTAARIREVFGEALLPDDTECQRLLAKLGYYGGAIDGKIGPLSLAAIDVFRRGWGIKGKNIDSIRRTLAIVAAEKIVK